MSRPRTRPVSASPASPAVREEYAGAELPNTSESQDKLRAMGASASESAPNDGPDDAALTRLLQNASTRAWLDEQVDSLRKQGVKVEVAKSASIWRWAVGPARFKIEGLQMLTWLDPQSNKEQSNVLLLATVLDGATKEAKEFVGRTVLVPLLYTLARRLAENCGGTVDRAHPPAAFFNNLYANPGGADLLISRAGFFVAHVECDGAGLPVYTNASGARRVAAHVQVAVWS